MRISGWFLAGAAACAAAAGCAGRKVMATDSQGPDWTQSLSGIEKGKAGAVLYAVGAWQNTAGDLPTGRDLAKANALKQLAESLKARQSSLVGAFNEVIGTQDKTRISLEKFGRVIQEQASSETLAGVLCPRVHYDKKNDITYVRCELDAASFKSMSEQLKGLDETTKEVIRKNAEKAFEYLRESAG